MTKQEFIQEAALRILGSHCAYTMKEVAENARNLADEIYCEQAASSDPVRPAPTVPDLSKVPIRQVLGEIDRMEACEKAEFEANRESPYNWYQRKGYATILRKAFMVEDVRTVGDLLKRGRIGCLKMRKVGRKSIEQIDKALLNLYGIKKW